MRKVHIDLTGPHPRSQHGFVYILTAICQFTKYLIAVPLRDKTALSVAKALVKHVYLVYGAGELEVSDQGKEFCNQIAENVARMMGVQKVHTTAWRPSANGVIERVHATMHAVFAKTVRENQRDWCVKGRRLWRMLTIQPTTAVSSTRRFISCLVGNQSQEST